MAWFFTMECTGENPNADNYLSPDIAIIPEEHARFEAMGKALGEEIEARYMAGPRDRDTPAYPRFNGPKSTPELDRGWRWPMPDEPFRDQLVTTQYELVDIIGSSFGAYAISQRVIDLIEAIEPGVHQYLPYEMLQPDSSVHPAKRWLLNVCTRAEVVDVERSFVVRLPVTNWFADKAGGEPKIVVRAAEASRRAIWCEWRYNWADRTLISGRLADALKAADIHGWQFGTYHHPNRVDEI
ncbi:MAG: DUF1629 domain-containing protein [Sphingomonas bacterium]